TPARALAHEQAFRSSPPKDVPVASSACRHEGAGRHVRVRPRPRRPRNARAFAAPVNVAQRPATQAGRDAPPRYAAGPVPPRCPAMSRAPTLVAVSLAVLACALPLAAMAQQPPAVTSAPAQATDDPEYRRCVTGRLRPQAVARGIPGEAFDRYLAGIAPDRSVLALLDAQPDFTTPIWDYLAGVVDDERVADGRAMLETHRELLAKVSAQYGVDPETIVAVWGVESDYGRVSGKRPLLQSLSVLSCFGRRQEFFRGELLAVLELLHRGDLRDPGITGSWAGAFGHTQFMPTTYARIAVDGDGDGRRDLVGSIPDALASTANYLKRSGWQPGRPWGHEVKLPAGFDASLA